MSGHKEAKYRNLIERAKASYLPHDITDDGKELRLYWCDACKEINLWTYWQGRNSLDAKIMLVGQDWGSPWDESAQKTMAQITRANHGLPYDYLDENPSITDDRMITLFREIGYDIKQHCSDLFFTNFILGYRNKGLSGGYKKSWADHDKDYFKELTNIIEPKVILCLGRSTFEGVLSAFNTINSPRIKNFNSFIESEHNPISVTLDNGKTVFIFALAHCGAMGTLNRNRGKEKSDDILSVQKEDWKRIVPYL
jgi:uracil-DNA glycosylase